jgi:fructose-specific phosphotransferase system IIC component
LDWLAGLVSSWLDFRLPDVTSCWLVGFIAGFLASYLAGWLAR